MIFEAKVSYGIVARLKGRRKFDAYAMTEMVPVEVPEISSSDASIAYWWQATPLQGSYRTRDEVRGKLAVHAFEGCLYQPLVARDEAVPGVSASAAFMKANKAVLAGTKLIDADALRLIAQQGALVHGHGSASINSPKEDDGNVGVVAALESSSRESNIARFSEHYGRFLLIDGILHARTQSPVVDMDIGAGSWRRFNIRDRDWRHSSPQTTYCITRFEDAKRIFRSNEQVYDSVDWRAVKPEIEDPTLIDFDETSFVVKMAATRLLEAMASGKTSSYARRSYLSNEPIETLVAYGELRDALRGDHDTAEVYRKLLALEEIVRGQGLYHTEAVNALALKERLERDGLAPEPALEFRP